MYSFFMGHRKYLRDPSELLAFLWYMKKKGRGSLRNPCLSLCLAKLRFGLYLIKEVLSKQLDGIEIDYCCRYRHERRVEAVEHTSMSWQDVAAILYSEGTLEEAFYQIAPCAEEYHNQT